MPVNDNDSQDPPTHDAHKWNRKVVMLCFNA